MAISGEYPQFPPMDIEDYLTLDTTSKTAKYEYLEGNVTMLAGGSSNHAIITVNVSTLLSNALADSPCLVFSPDIRVKLAEDKYVHPDVTVSCDERDIEQRGSIEYPRIVVEVLSPSTEHVDRGRKLLYYKSCPTLQEYILIDSREQLLDIYSREGGKWVSATYGPKSRVEIASINLIIPIETIYKKTRF